MLGAALILPQLLTGMALLEGVCGFNDVNGFPRSDRLVVRRLGMKVLNFQFLREQWLLECLQAILNLLRETYVWVEA